MVTVDNFGCGQVNPRIIIILALESMWIPVYSLDKSVDNSVDVVVIGGGHAGCEAALACARMGLSTVLFAMNLDAIAMMPCNPNIGGSSKGHLVREIDALGGEMGKNIDKTFIQSRMLNTGKGPAVYALRAQADKSKYSRTMKQTLENTENLRLRQTEVVDLLVENGRLSGVVLESGAVVSCKAAILCLGTYLKARCLYGETIVQSGPNGLRHANGLAEALKRLGIRLFRFKTGTPARIDGSTINLEEMAIQPGDETITPFSFDTDPAAIQRTQLPCYLTYTNEETHKVIRESLNRSPLFAGVIEGTGTRYCPSIEDKVVRFADKDRHQVFIEPEGEDTNEVYVSGMSTSLPEDVQEAMYRTVPGLRNCRLTRNGYAIEYDCLDATQLNLGLGFKDIEGLYSAGQFNGSSGYEEAAAQGILAGLNAGRYAQGKTPIHIDRSQGYIGVLVDDLVTKGSQEPYRMMTSRAEYRLLLRQDNADLRLMAIGYEAGLVQEVRYQKLLAKQEAIEKELKRLEAVVLPPTAELNAFLEANQSTPVSSGVTLAELMRRPELSYSLLTNFDKDRPELFTDVAEQVNIQVKYAGYIKRQMQQVEQFKKLESRKLPQPYDYSQIHGLRLEARQKLNAILPENIGQASRITGVSPADIAVLLVHMAKHTTDTGA